MIAFIAGFVVGFFTTLPIGPINIAVMTKGLSGKTGQGLMIGAGSGLMDIAYCAAAMFGISSLNSNPKIELIFRIATFGIFFLFGIKTTFFNIQETKVSKSEESPGFKRYFLLHVAAVQAELHESMSTMTLKRRRPMMMTRIAMPRTAPIWRALEFTADAVANRPPGTAASAALPNTGKVMPTPMPLRICPGNHPVQKFGVSGTSL